MEDSKFSRLHLNGGAFVFDFTNTLNARTVPAPTDYLESYIDILAWANKTTLLPKKRLMELSHLAQTNKPAMLASFNKAIHERENLYLLFSSIAKRKKPAATVLKNFNSALASCFANINLDISAAHTDVNFYDDNLSLEEPLRIVMKSAYDMLTAENMERIKECSSCGWLFIDRTKNGKRRWCDMKVCGSNDKAKRYYHRHKKP